MAEATLKPLGGPVTKKDNFVSGGKKVLRAPRVKKLSDPGVLDTKIMMFGPWSTGKTWALVGLLLHGLKVFVLSTDIGDSGTITVHNELHKMGRLDLAENLFILELQGYEEVSSFLDNPASVDPDFYNRDLDFLVWEGFSNFQQVDIAEFVGEQAEERVLLSENQNKSITEARAEGLSLEQLDWNVVRNATIRSVRKFLSIKNQNGKALNKLLTCHEAIRQKQGDLKKGIPSKYVDARSPLVQGAGGILMGAGFDIIINTRVSTDKDEDEAARKYTYVISPAEFAATKNRGFDFETVEPGDMYALWAKISKQINALKVEEPKDE